jgi:3-hydroxyisobutyrate dehydrogenase-like beta-hydroxyacid dehydrogenase
MRAPKMAEIMHGKDAGPVTFSLSNALKDARTMAAEGKARGIDLPLIARTADCIEEAVKAGWGAGDCAAQPVFWARRGSK